MCGICGILNGDTRPVMTSTLRAMNGMLWHRGPDGSGEHLAGPVGLAMRRLSIIDVAGSDQPLYNEDRTIAVVFNGEIFNYRDLRAHLIKRGHRFNTQGDGETIAHLYEEYGDDAPRHLRGQFAFALWDARRQRLLLARDRLGQKPLYYTQQPDLFVFASEIKALLQHPDVPRRSALDDPAQLALCLAYGYVPAPQTAFEGIQMLLPGHRLTLDHGGAPIIDAYWQPPTPAPADPEARAEDHVEQLRATLREAVSLRLISDVPLGAFLSGGLDSSLIVALMQQISGAQVKTFSIGFAGGAGFDETPYAQQVADLLGTEHTAFTVEAHAMELLPQLVWHLDAPFADSSVIPTYLVSDLTRQQVTVALTGDGGDELFAGYERFYAASLARRLGAVPRPLWRLAGRLFDLLPEGTGYADRVKRAGRFIRAAGMPLALAYFDWVRLFDAQAVHALTGQPDIGGQHFAGLFAAPPDDPAILHANLTTYLPDDLLIKADRCSMAASLEARAPFLDHVLMEQAAAVPYNLKLRGRTTKYLLKEMARDLLPDEIIDRKKHGFGAPIGAWLRQDIRPVQDVLLSRPARERGLLRMNAVEKLIQEHASGQRDHGFRLWTLLTLETWYQQFIDRVPEPPAAASGITSATR